MSWNSMETAPKDGSEFIALGYFECGLMEVNVVRWIPAFEDWADYTGRSPCVKPKFWIAIPDGEN